MQEMLLTAESMWHHFRRSYEKVDLYIAPSHFMAGQIARRIPAHKIKVLHNGIDPKELEAHYNDDGYALYFGRLSREKGVETLLKAHELIGNRMKLKILGTGPQDEYLRSNYRSAEYLGYKSGTELHQIIRKAGFVIVPSEWNENCSMTILEAMAMGKPVIGSDIGGIPEQIENNVTGLLFNMGDAEDLSKKMQILISDPNLRVSMGKSARKKLEEEYSLEKHCLDLLDIYNKLQSY